MTARASWLSHAQVREEVTRATDRARWGWDSAVRLAAATLAGDSGSVDARDLFAAAGVTVRVKRLQAQLGGRQAELVDTASGVSVIVDPDPTPREEMTCPLYGRLALEKALLKGRVAHELGHWLLHWRPSEERVKRRFVWTSAEELFCDEFAAAFLCGAEMPRTDAAGLLEFAVRRGIDLDSAARARVGDVDDHVTIGAFADVGDRRVRWSRSYGRRLANSEAVWLQQHTGSPSESPHSPQFAAKHAFVAVVSGSRRHIVSADFGAAA